jgi:chromosome segregation ATPase
VNENKNLRNALEQRNKEFKNFIEVRANAQNSNSEIVMDYEHVMKLEERNAKLSQENDILMTNYNNLQREYTDFRMRINSEFQNNNEKAIAFDEANEQYENLKNNVYNLNEMNKVNQLKIFELSDKNSKLEIENNELKENEERLNQQIMQLETSLNYYKELVEKLN